MNKEDKIRFAKLANCSFYCSDGSGRPTKEHDPRCPFYIKTPYYEAMLSQSKE